MRRNDIAGQLIDLVRTDLVVDVPNIDATSRLVGDLGLDSVAFAIALLAIEERFDVRLSEQELISCQTIDDVTSALEQHLLSIAPIAEMST